MTITYYPTQCEKEDFLSAKRRNRYVKDKIFFQCCFVSDLSRQFFAGMFQEQYILRCDHKP